MRTDQPERPMIRLRTRALRDMDGWGEIITDQGMAFHLGVSPATLSRIMRGRPAGSRFIAAVLYAFPHTAFDDLFVIELESSHEA